LNKKKQIFYQTTNVATRSEKATENQTCCVCKEILFEKRFDMLEKRNSKSEKVRLCAEMKSAAKTRSVRGEGQDIMHLHALISASSIKPTGRGP